MKLSVLLPELLPQYDFKLENEQEFSTLGLVVAEVKEPFCTFVDTEHALKDLHDGITMVITTPEIAPKLVKQGRGVCITEQPRVVFSGCTTPWVNMEGMPEPDMLPRSGKTAPSAPWL